MAVVRQPGPFDVEERPRELSAKGEDLERIAALVDFGLFRPELERGVPRADGTKVGQPPPPASRSCLQNAHTQPHHCRRGCLKPPSSAEAAGFLEVSSWLDAADVKVPEAGRILRGGDHRGRHGGWQFRGGAFLARLPPHPDQPPPGRRGVSI